MGSSTGKQFNHGIHTDALTRAGDACRYALSDGLIDASVERNEAF
jgi:hypothetical protein